jgi:hypothetical protein
MKKNFYNIPEKDMICSSWEPNIEKSSIKCGPVPNEIRCSVKRKFQTKNSEILIKNDGLERFMMGFLVFSSKSKTEPIW